jgi:hypothetical protein
MAHSTPLVGLQPNLEGQREFFNTIGPKADISARAK